ncbi:hypothetical protein ACLB2K_026762 [Fragaria x ananassa]
MAGRRIPATRISPVDRICPVTGVSPDSHEFHRTLAEPYHTLVGSFFRAKVSHAFEVAAIEIQSRLLASISEKESNVGVFDLQDMFPPRLT